LDKWNKEEWAIAIVAILLVATILFIAFVIK